MNVKRTISISRDKKYLSQVISELPTNCIFDKGKVGCGGTTIALENLDKYVVAVPFISLIENKVAKYNGKVFGVDGNTKKNDLIKYLETVKVPKFMVTYDSLEKLMGWIQYEDYKILVDEMHLLFTQYSFRRDAAQCILRNYKKFREFCFMTATILEDEFILEELKDIDVVIAEWESVKEVEVQSVKCNNSVSATVAQLIKDFLNGKYNGNGYFFVNSVEFIKEMVKECGLNDSNARAVWSRNNKTETGLLRGKAGDSPKRINLLTSTCFEGCDIFDENAYIFVVSDSRKAHTLLDISTSFQQIANRVRNTKFGDKIFHIYTNTRYSSDVSYDDFKTSTLDGIEVAKGLVVEYNGLSDIARKSISSVCNESYIDKLDDKFIFDPNLVKIDLYNFKISKCLYKLRANLNEEYKKNGYTVSEFNHSAIEIVRMDKVEDKTFKEIVDELEGTSKYDLNSFELYRAAYEKYPFLREAIEKIGFEGIKESNYVITNIKSKLIVRSDKSNETKIFKLLSSKASISNGEFIESNKVKKYLNDIYAQLGLTKKAKGTDILNYYEVKDSKEVSKKIDGKTVKGYVIIRSKIIFK